MKKLCKLLSVMLLLSLLLCSMPVWAADGEAEGTEDKDAAPSAKQIVRAVEDIPRGTRIFEHMLKVETLDANVPFPKNALTDVEDVKGKYAAQTIYAGEYIYSEETSDTAKNKANEHLLLKEISVSSSEYVVVTDYIIHNTGEDISFLLQEIIDKNPNKTIYFPDGVYTLEYPIYTASAASRSVSLQLADGAVIKASNNWRGKTSDALINSGTLTPTFNDIVSVGHYYSIMGGTIDANHRANGINVDGGREALYRNICIKNANIGINIGHGVNNTSMDVDFEDITIIGNGRRNTIGLKNIAADNTYSNFRIYNVQIGIENKGGGFLKSLYVINDNEDLIARGDTVGIITSGNSWVTGCYTENCETGNRYDGGTIALDCAAAWTSDACKKQVAFACPGGTITLVSGRAYFNKVEGGEYQYTTGKSVQDVVILDKSLAPQGIGEKTHILPLS